MPTQVWACHPAAPSPAPLLTGSAGAVMLMRARDGTYSGGAPMTEEVNPFQSPQVMDAAAMPPRRADFVPADGRAALAVALLIAVMVANLVSAGSTWLQIGLLQRAQAGGQISRDEVQGNDVPPSPCAAARRRDVPHQRRDLHPLALPVEQESSGVGKSKCRVLAGLGHRRLVHPNRQPLHSLPSNSRDLEPQSSGERADAACSPCPRTLVGPLVVGVVPDNEPPGLGDCALDCRRAHDDPLPSSLPVGFS